MAASSRTPARVIHRGAVCLTMLLLPGPAAMAADAAAEARFRGTGKADPIRITNVSRAPAADGAATTVAFDLAWDHSWRAGWEVAAAETGDGRPLRVENWDAAWVFAKFRAPGADGWSPATLSARAEDHVPPAGATIDVGLSDDGGRGVGAFVFRAGVGHGPNAWQGVRLRWLHQTDGVPDPAAVELRLFAIHMVHVPAGGFWAGDGTEAAYLEEITWGKRSRLAAQLSAGDTSAALWIEGEGELTLGGDSPKNLNNRDGLGAWLWLEDFATREPRLLPAAFPKGHAAFYCMRHEVTEGEFVDFLNTLPAAQQEKLLNPRAGALINGITVAEPGKPGTPAVAKSSLPHVACASLVWLDGVEYAGWAGLRPMTELEYEKACRGPVRPVPGEFAWGTPAIVGTDFSAKLKASKSVPHDGYVLHNAGQPDEHVTWSGADGPTATRGNAVWDGTIRRLPSGRPAPDAVTRPLRVGAFATPDSDRVSAGASYWGILELSGNLWERVVPLGAPMAREFAGTHGVWPEQAAKVSHRVLCGCRGGAVDDWPVQTKERKDELMMRVSDRGGARIDSPREQRVPSLGFRGVRTVLAGRSPVRASWAALDAVGKGFGQSPSKPVETAAPQVAGFGKSSPAVRIENVTVARRDARTATVTFDVAWNGSWRNPVNHDAAWVVFKVRPGDDRPWEHAPLVADKLVRPTGYGQADGTALEAIVPTDDGVAVGMFLRRAEAGEGEVAARGVTTVIEWPAAAGPIVAANVRPFAVLMVYVPEGPFSLGSGGIPAGGFYRYTDGSQHTMPYRVTGPGPIPTGRQVDRLWAGKAAQPEDGGEIPASFPNGYGAFYCMKFQITPDQYVAFLESLSPEEGGRRYAGAERFVQQRVVYSGGLPSVTRDASSTPVRYGTRPGGPRGGVACFGLSWEDGASFAAWAGLRPMTELEVEKAVRGPREPTRNEVGPSYWGLQTFNTSEWDGFKGDPQGERAVTVGNATGRGFKATHGRGTTALPADWPQADAVGSGFRCTHYALFCVDLARTRVSDRLLAAFADPQRLFSYRWRGVRTAPPGVGP